MSDCSGEASVQVCNPSMKGNCIMADDAKADESRMHRVYSVIERPKKDDYWHQVGVAFPHKDGKGWNVLLEVTAHPKDGITKLVIREKAPKEEQTSDGDTPKKA